MQLAALQTKHGDANKMRIPFKQRKAPPAKRRTVSRQGSQPALGIPRVVTSADAQQHKINHLKMKRLIASGMPPKEARIKVYGH